MFTFHYRERSYEKNRGTTYNFAVSKTDFLRLSGFNIFLSSLSRSVNSKALTKFSLFKENLRTFCLISANSYFDLISFKVASLLLLCGCAVINELIVFKI